MHPLQRNGNLACQGFEQLHLLGYQQPASPPRLQGQHAAYAHGGLQGHVVPGAGRQRGRGQAGPLAVAETPVGDAGIQALGHRSVQCELVGGIGEQHMGLAAQAAPDGGLAQLHHLLGLQGGAEVARERKEGVGPALAAGGHAGGKAQIGGELANEHAHAQHHRKGHQVLHIGHRKGKARWHKEEVKGRHRHKGRQHRRAAPQAHRHQHHAQEKQHDDVGQVKQGQHGQGEQGGCHAGGHGKGIGPPAGVPEGGPCSVARIRRNGRRQAPHGLGGSHLPQVDVRCQRGQLARQAGPP